MSVKRARYRPDHRSFQEFMVSEQAYKPVRQVSTDIMKRMIATAPRSGDGRGEPYADSFRLEPQAHYPKVGRYRAPRAAARIINTADHAPAIEYGYMTRGGTALDRAIDSAMGMKQDRSVFVKGRRIMLRAGLRYGHLPHAGRQADL